MMSRARVYMGRDGFRGMSEIRRTSYLEKMSGPKKRPSVYMSSGGVSARTVLANGGIVGGGMVRVRPVTTAKSLYVGGRTAAKSEAKERAAEKKVVPRFPIIPPKEENTEKLREVEAEEIKAVTSPTEERVAETKPQVGMTETEERLADFLGVAQEVLPLRAVLPEPPLGGILSDETGKKKHRKRRGRKPRVSTEVSEEVRATIQAELEAASDAAANEQ